MSAWPVVALGEVLTLVNGRAYKQREHLNTGTPVIRIQNLNGGNKWFYSDLVLPENKYCVSGDLLFAWSASFGPYIWDGPRSIYHYHIWKVIPSDRVDKKFAFYLLDNITNSVKASGRGISMIHVTKSGMEAWQIPLPPLNEQKRIAAILDKADGLRRKRRQALELLETLTQSIFVEMFGDPVNDNNAVNFLSELTSEIKIGPFGSVLHKREYIENGIPLVNPKHIINGSIETDRIVTISIEKYNQLSAYHLQKNDVVLARRGEMGRCAVVKEEKNQLCGTGSMYIRPNFEKLLPEVLQHIFSSPSGVRYFENASSGVTMANINRSIVADMKLMCPPMNQQNKFLEVIQRIELGRNCFLATVIQLDALFASLQSRAFRGEL